MPLPVVFAAVGFTIAWAALLWVLAGRSRAMFGLIALGVVLGSLGAALPASFLNQVLLGGLTRTVGDLEARRVVIGTFWDHRQHSRCSPLRGRLARRQGTTRCRGGGTTLACLSRPAR